MELDQVMTRIKTGELLTRNSLSDPKCKGGSYILGAK